MADPTTKGVGTFTVHPKARQFLSNYSDIGWHRTETSENPFSMGSKYNNSFEFLRSVYQAAQNNNAVTSFDKFEKKFSYVHQIMAENGGLDPLIHMAIMQDISTKLGPHVLENAFPSQVDIKTGAVSPVYSMSMQKNPFFAFLGSGHLNGSGGATVQAGGQFNQGRVNYMNSFLKQSQGIKSSSRTPFSEVKDEFNTRAKKKDFKGKDC